MLIRRETAADIAEIGEVVGAAFRAADRPDETPPEARLVDALRESDAWLPALSMVAARADGTVIGHVLATRGYVESWPALALAPLSVVPEEQGRGVGSALMHAILGAADALGEPLVALLGEPHYYRRFGFRPSTDYGVEPPYREWKAHFQVRVLAMHDSTMHGAFTYPEPFDDL